MRIVVLMGGTNLDRDTSLVSGWQVARALREVGYETAAVDTTKAVGPVGSAAFGDLGERVEAPPIDVEPPSMIELASLRHKQDGHVLAPGVLDLCRAADCVFVALFGDEGEGGRAQGVLEYARVTYTGPDLLGCAVSFDKDIAKRLVSGAGIPTAEWVTVPHGDHPGRSARNLLPAVVKPVRGGSSIGASAARSPAALTEAVATAHATGQDALVERLLPGREFTVGVLRGQALPAVELVTERDLVDYRGKYQPGSVDRHCPADLDPSAAATLAGLAVTAHDRLKLGLRTCSRMDFRMDGDGVFHFLECNPLPGLTPSSFLPLAARTAGLGFPDLCSAIVDLAMEGRGQVESPQVGDAERQRAASAGSRSRGGHTVVPSPAQRR